MQLSEPAYGTLAALKREGESFSDVVLRLAASVKDPRALLRLGPRIAGYDVDALRRRSRDAELRRLGERDADR